MPAGGPRKRSRNDGLVPPSGSRLPADRGVSRRQVAPLRHAAQHNKPKENTFEGFLSETDDDVPIAKRIRRRTDRKTSQANRTGRPTHERKAVRNSSYSSRPNLRRHLSPKSGLLHGDDHCMHDVQGEGSAITPHYQKDQIEGIQGRGTANVIDSIGRTTNAVVFPFNKPGNELDEIETHTAILFAIPLLWNNAKSQLGPRFTELSELVQFLRGDSECNIYVGQDLGMNTNELFQDIIAVRFMKQLEDCLQTTGVDQRVPILNPKRLKLDPPEMWPRINDYQDYVLREHNEALQLTKQENCYRVSKRRRLFSARETCTLGLSPSNRVREMLMTWGAVLPGDANQGVKRRFSEPNFGEVLKEETAQAKQKVRSRRRSELHGSNPKANLRMQEPSSGISTRPRRKRRPNILYTETDFDQHVFDASDSDSEENEASTKKVSKPMGSDPPYIPSAGVPQVLHSSLTEDFLGTESSENEFEIPVHLVTISNYIDYIPGEGVHSSSSCSSQAEDEVRENHAKEPPYIVDKLDESEGGDSKDPLFDGVEDKILRMIDEQASGELLTKHVLDEQLFAQGEHIEGDNLKETQAGGRGCPSKPQNLELRLNEEGHTIQYGVRCPSNEREGHHSASQKKDADSSDHANDTNSGSSPMEFRICASSRQHSNIRNDVMEAEKVLISDDDVEQNTRQEQGDPGRAIGTTRVHNNSSSPKSVACHEKRVAPLDAEDEETLKRTGVRPSIQNRSVQGPPVINMVPLDGDSIQGNKCTRTKLRKSARVQTLQKNSDSPSELLHASAPATRTNEKDGSTCDSTYAYLWDHQTRSRDEKGIPLRDAISRCLESDRYSIYDGQDFDFADLSSSALIGMTEKERASWGNREAQPGKTRKVRVWNLETGGLKTPYRSPAVQRLAAWVDSNPGNVVFSPSMILPSSIANLNKVRSVTPRVQENGSPILKACFRKQVEDQVLQRIRDLRIRGISKDNPKNVQVWDTFRKRIEPIRRFESHEERARFLFANPWLEPLVGQDQLFLLESSTLHKLIRVRLSCAASIATYWDCVDRKVYTHDDKSEVSRTIGEFLASNTRYLLYQGQDTPYFQSLVNYNAVSRSAGFHALFKCGVEIQRAFFAKRWVTVVVDPSSCSTACAIFWNKESKTVHMQPEMCSRISISSYVKAHPYMELYAGQDRSEIVQQEVRHWMGLVQKCSPQESRGVVLLTRCEFAPLKYKAVAFTNVSREHGIGSTHNQKESGNLSSVFRNENQTHQVDGHEMLIHPNLEETLTNASIERRKRTVPDSYVDDEKGGGTDIKLKLGVPATMCEGKDFDSTTPFADEIIVLEPSVCTSIGSDDIFSQDEMMCPELEEISQNFEEGLRAPVRAAARLLTLIKEVVPRVLKQDLVHDLRHTLYENTTMEVGSVSQLLRLVEESNDLHFVRMAAELCSALESLDVSGSFTGKTDIGYGASDLFLVREDLESGKIFTMTDVIRRFRMVCQHLIQLNEGFYFEYEAIDLKEQAENIIERYMREKKDVFKREVKILRLAKICDRARQIGFRKQRNRNPSNAGTAAGSKGHDLTIRSSSGQARVTFLNYRDEKGNSVMGKRTSVRVFGLPIDRRACQRDAGGARPCHICGREVFEADEDSLTCGNRFFGSCNECVCKPCLESVTCMETPEFISFRNGQEWLCVHCRGLCPAGSKCLRNEYERSQHRNRLESVRFAWPHKFVKSPMSVLVSLLRRNQNGEFGEDPERGDFVSLCQTTCGTWSALTHCRIGAYRAFLKADGKWVAGTTFFVFSSDVVTMTDAQTSNKFNVIKTYYACQDRPRTSVSRRGPRVHWIIAEKNRSGPVHAIRKDSEDANKMIEDCSRVNGYDWQRAKRHNVVHWRPVVQEADPQEVEKERSRSYRSQHKSHCFTSKTQNVTLTHSVKDHSSWIRNGVATPKPRLGLSYEQLCTVWNTLKYDEMLKSLWGIVTGRSGIHGMGLFTLTGYRKGDFIIEYAGDLIRTPLADIREARYEAAGLGTYLFKINEQEIVDATVESNRARFTNHSCDPNMIARIIHVRGRDLVALQATRDIPRFAELTFDYKLPIEDKKVQCLCNAWNCVGVMN